MVTALIDGDIVCYRSAASAEKDDAQIALIRANRTLQDIVSVTGCDEARVFLSGSTNFRKDIYPEYKANRIKYPRPKHLETTREFLVLKWGAEVADGYEADDAIGMAMDKGAICCSIDKDLKQLEGTHYNFVESAFSVVSEIEGLRNFYSQLVLGDRGDNVPGYDGKMRIKWPKFLAETREMLDRSRTAYDMYCGVKGIYKDEQTLIRNARLLYIWRKLNDEWQPPTKAEATSDAKPEEVQRLESILTKGEETTPSMARGGTKPKRAGSRKPGAKKASVSPKKRRGS